MSMSTYVKGVRPADETWHRMKNVWDACKDAGVPVPGEVDRFFDGDDPDPAGVIIDLDENKHPAVRKWNDEYSSGLEVILSQLPPDVTVVRFINSW